MKTADNANSTFTYDSDGDGMGVQEDFYNGTTTVTTLYFADGMYEGQDSGGADRRLRWMAGER